MKAKLTVLREKYPVLISFILSALWIGIMLFAGVVLRNIPFIIQSQDEYLGQLFIDLIGTAFGIMLLYLFNYQSIFKERKYGFGKGLLTGLYFVIIGLIAISYSFLLPYLDALMTGTEAVLTLKPVSHIIIFTITMILIGSAEELTFRGVIANVLFDKYGKSSAGVWFSTIMTGVVFGAMHIFNAINPEISFFSALVQSIAAGVIGMALTAVYYRSRNIWLLIFLHAFIDFGALFSSGFFDSGSMTSTIGSYTSLNLLGCIPYIIVLLVLLRKSKMSEILGENARENTKQEKRKLTAVILTVALIAIGTFISGLPDLVPQSDDNVITSFSGTSINQDMICDVEITEDGYYEIVMGAENVTEGCIIDQYLKDEEGNICVRHLTDSGVGYFDQELSAGKYIFHTIVLSSVEEFEAYIKEKEYEMEEDTMEHMLQTANKTEPGEYSVYFSFVLTRQ